MLFQAKILDEDWGNTKVWLNKALKFCYFTQFLVLLLS